MGQFRAIKSYILYIEIDQQPPSTVQAKAGFSNYRVSSDLIILRSSGLPSFSLMRLRNPRILEIWSAQGTKNNHKASKSTAAASFDLFFSSRKSSAVNVSVGGSCPRLCSVEALEVLILQLPVIFSKKALDAHIGIMHLLSKCGEQLSRILPGKIWVIPTSLHELAESSSIHDLQKHSPLSLQSFLLASKEIHPKKESQLTRRSFDLRASSALTFVLDWRGNQLSIHSLVTDLNAGKAYGGEAREDDLHHRAFL